MMLKTSKTVCLEKKYWHDNVFILSIYTVQNEVIFMCFLFIIAIIYYFIQSYSETFGT